MDYLPTEGGQMKISELIHDRLTDEQMTSLLFSNIIDDKEKGDCIFVPGSNKAIEYRLPKGVEMYDQGRANRILFSGGVVWEGTNMSEALMLKKEALELGVREGDILIEDVSKNIQRKMFLLRYLF